jgi:quercetin dioxygenase-like cupin family protein
MSDAPLSAGPTLFSHDDDGGWTDLGTGARRRVRLSLPEMMVVEFRFEAGAIGPLHSHPHIQSSYVVSGSFDVTIDGRTERLGPGGGYIVPPNLVHGVVALERGHLVDVFTPRRDDFLPGS